MNHQLTGNYYSLNVLNRVRPIHQRVGELARKRKEKLHQLWMEQQMDPELTFKPTINPNSREQAKDKSFAERISEDAKEHIGTSCVLEIETNFITDKKLKKQEELQREEMSKLTFTPQVNANSERIVHSIFRGDANFWQRQQVYDIKRSQTKNSVPDHQLEACTFKPQLNETSEILVEVMQERDGRKETRAERIERLAREDFDKKMKTQENAKQQYYSQFTFKPQINQVSKTIIRSTSLDELVSAPARKKVLEEAKQAAEEAFKQAHTFHPQINTPKRRGKCT